MQETAFSPLKSLDCLCRIFPVKGAIVVGTGMGNGPWFDLLLQQAVDDVLLIEADKDNVKYLEKKYSSRNQWKVLHQVVSDQEEESLFYRLSNKAESSLVHPDLLKALWPNISTKEELSCSTVTLDGLAQEKGYKANWLVIDCLPAISMLNGAENNLSAFDVVVVRIVIGNDGTSQLFDVREDIDAMMQKQGLVSFGIEPELHPSLGHAVYIRDIPHQTVELKRLYAELELFRKEWLEKGHAWEQEKKELQQAKEESDKQAERLIASQLQRIDELTQELHDVQFELDERTQALKVQTEQVKNEVDKQEREVQHKAANWCKEKAELQQAHALELRKVNEELLLQQRQSLEKQQDQVEEALKKQISVNENLKETEKRLRNDLKKGLANAVKQVEAFMSIQNYLNSGELLCDFHGWPISPDIGLFLLEKMYEQHYDLIIEFGSGTSTAMIAKGVEMMLSRTATGDGTSLPEVPEIVSFEHDIDFYKKTYQILRNRGLVHLVQLEHTSLVDWSEGEQNYLYYDCQSTLTALAQKCADRQLRILLLVDGPPGSTCTNARYPAVPFVFSAFGRHQIDVVLDDADRPEEKNVIDLWRKYWTKRFIHLQESFMPSEKGLYFASTQQ